MSGPDALTALAQAVSAPSGTVELLTDSSEPTSSLSAATSVRLDPPNVVLQKSQPTRYLRANSTDQFYTLEALLLVYLSRDAPVAEFIRHSREVKDSVNITERNKVLEYLQNGGDIPNDRVVPLRSTTPTEEPSPSGAPAPSGSQAALGPSVTSASPTKRRYVPSAADLEAVKRIRASEVELRDRSTALRGIKINNFGPLRQTYSAHLKKLRGEPSSSKQSASAPAPSITSDISKSPGSVGGSRKRSLYPIIMISSSPTALITMWNVKKFLNDAVFETSAEARERAVAEGNPRPEPLIQIYRRVSSVDSSGKEVIQNLKYQIVDGVETLNRLGGGTDPWERVVCVMTTGQAWQFKPYKWSEPRLLFHHVKGMYVSWASDPPNTKIKDWNVTELKIDPHRRYLDKSSVAHFWKILDDWVGHHKPWVMKSQ